MTPKKFAQIYSRAFEIHEASYEQTKTSGKYVKSWEECILEALRNAGEEQSWLTPLLVLCLSGFVDVEDWAKSFL